MTTAELVVGIGGLMIGILIGIRLSPVREFHSLRRCKCGNDWPGLFEWKDGNRRDYWFECRVCGAISGRGNTPDEAIREWNRSGHRESGK